MNGRIFPAIVNVVSCELFFFINNSLGMFSNSRVTDIFESLKFWNIIFTNRLLRLRVFSLFVREKRVVPRKHKMANVLYFYPLCCNRRTRGFFHGITASWLYYWCIYLWNYMFFKMLEWSLISYMTWLSVIEAF